MFPLITFTDFHDDVTYVGGAFQLALSLVWAGMVTMQPGEDITKVDLQQLFLCLPLTKYALILGRKISFYDDWLAHPDHDGYWRPASVGDGFNKITVPVYSIGNWYDIFARSTVQNFHRLREAAPSSLGH